jgi:histone-lysine N-methyltransferase SETD7
MAGGTGGEGGRVCDAGCTGVRLSHEEVDGRDWELNSNTISLDEDTVLDVPQRYSSTDSYCATLGHKANHSSSANACYDVFDHPLFGFIKCVRALQHIPRWQEITVDYGFDGEHGYPDWWQQQQQQQQQQEAAAKPKRKRGRCT